MSNKLGNNEWFNFKYKMPKEHSGLLIRIIPTGLSDPFDPWETGVLDKVFYGFLYGHKIRIVYCVTENVGCHWKATNDYDIGDMYWYNSTDVWKNNGKESLIVGRRLDEVV